MKKLLYLLLLTPIIYLASCSSAKDGLSPETGPIEETIVGKTWKLLGIDAGWFHLNDNNTYLTKDYLCDTLEEFGTWELDGSVLIFKYTDGPIEYIERNTIIEYNNSIVKLQADTSATLDINIIFEVTTDVVGGCMDLTGIWERSALRYTSVEWIWGDDVYEDGVLVMEGHWEDQNHQSVDLIGSEMASHYNYDRYVIEFHLDNTYDEYMYNNDVASHNTGNWDIDLASENLIIDGISYPYQKTNENAYELSIPTIWPNSPGSSNGYSYDGIMNMYEQYVRID